MSSGIGIKIRQLREAKNLPQKELAFELDVSQSYLSKVETGSIKSLSFAFMTEVCTYFRVNIQYFLGNERVINEVHKSHYLEYEKVISGNSPPPIQLYCKDAVGKSTADHRTNRGTK